MGNDGGSIPTRRELVKEAARNPTTAQIKESQAEQQEYLWTTDPVTQKALDDPIVSDAHGKLYNKDTILEFLLEGARKADVERATLGSIQSLKDVVELKFHVDEAGQKGSKHWSCPVTGDKLGPGSKAVYIVPCGHVFSATAIKEVSGEKCLTCETEYAANDVVPIVPVGEDDVARLTLRLKTLREKGLTHSLKKASGSKKRKKHESAAEDKPTKAPLKESDSGINNASTASLTAKVMQAQDQAKRRKHDTENVKSLFTNKDGARANGKNNDFMTRGFDVPVNAKR